MLIDTEAQMAAQRLLQQPGEPLELERLGTQRLDDANAEKRLLKPSRQLRENLELRGGEATDRIADSRSHAPMKSRRAHRGDDQQRARAHEQVAVERDEQRRREDGADDRLQPARRRTRI